MQAQNSDHGGEMDWLWLSLYHAFAMLWATFWALVLGFTISGVLQVFVSKEQMSRAFGRTNLKSVAIATGLGAASSSCSYAAVAAARSAIQQGAALVPALAFMFASTNLVIELGAILWVLMGWQFVLAEIVGAFLLIVFMWCLMRLFLPKNIETEIRARMAKQEAQLHCHSDQSQAELAATSQSASGHEHAHHRSEHWNRAEERAMDVGRSFVRDGLVHAVERNSGRILNGWISGDAGAARLVASIISPKRTCCCSIDRKRTGRPDHRRDLIRLFRREYSTSESALGPWHQFRRRNFVYLRRPACHPDPRDLRKILWCARRGLDHRYFLRGDGSRRNHCRSRIHRIGINSARTASTERN